MARIVYLDRDFQQLAIQKGQDTIDKIKRTEKRIFPKDEAMDFDLELAKRNTELTVVLGSSDDLQNEANIPLAAYMVVAKVHGITLLHKICVLEKYQRQGIARRTISQMIEKCRNQGCERVQLWVDYSRTPARDLYSSLGFRVVDSVRDYYGKGRTGIKMVLDLNSVW
jgi:ribosomal protein S18 acetylase RimI-like enzyme